MVKNRQPFEEKRLFRVAQELNVSTDRVEEYLRDNGYEDALSGRGLTAKISSQEAYLAVREEFGDQRVHPPEEGETVTAIVRNLHSDHGAFVRVGAFGGRIRMDELAWQYIDDPSEVLEKGDRVECTVLHQKEIDGQQKLELSRKQLLPSPWEKHQEGSIVKGTVNNITEYGAFVDLDSGVTGLIHKSEMSWTDAVKDPKKRFEVGESIEVRVINVNEENERISLSTRKVVHEQGFEVSDLPAIDTHHKGEVVHVDFADGLIIKVRPGVFGHLPTDELYWDRILNTPSDIGFSRGDEIDVSVLDLGRNSLSITLSHKRTKPDPWPKYASQFTEGPIYDSEVRTVTDTEAIVRLLQNGPEAKIAWSHLKKGFRINDRGEKIKEDLSHHYQEGDQLKVRVIRLDNDQNAAYLREVTAEHNPDEDWLSYKKEFYEGSRHNAIITHIEDDGTLKVDLPDGPTALLPKTLLLNDPNSEDYRYSPGDAVTAKVHHFSLSNRAIILKETPPLTDLIPDRERSFSADTSLPRIDLSSIRRHSSTEKGSANKELEAIVLDLVEPKLKDKIEKSLSDLKSELSQEIRQVVDHTIQDHPSFQTPGDSRQPLPKGLLEKVRNNLIDEFESLIDQRIDGSQKRSQDDVVTLKENLRSFVNEQKKLLHDWTEDLQDQLRDSHTDRIQSLRQALDLPGNEADLEKGIPTPQAKFEGKEAKLIHYISQYVRGKGLYYQKGVIENFYTCLKCDPMVILSGLSGVGKSKLPKHFADAVGGVFRMVPVRPNWNDDRDLLGYFNSRSGTYQSTVFLDTIIEAGRNRDRLYILCLDEMNLATPEYYFALFLSKLESDEKTFHPDPSLSKSVIQDTEDAIIGEMMDLQTNESLKDSAKKDDVIEYKLNMLSSKIDSLEKYYEVEIPPNIKFVGTVNIDHTTEGFSNKVLDRANVIQFGRPSLKEAQNLDEGELPPKFLPFTQFQEFTSFTPKAFNQDPLSHYASQLIKINNLLAEGLSFGHRVYNAILRYMQLAHQADYEGLSDSEEGLSLDEAFDLQLIQRVLPKMRGMDKSGTKDSLENLKSFLSNHDYKRSEEKVNSMINQLNRSGYVNYWEV